MRRLWRNLGLGLVLGFAAQSAAAETVHLTPDGSKHWGVRNVFAPVTSLFLGPSYWYGDRELVIETTPPGAHLDLFYVRTGFQKGYEQAESPATVVLPRRIEANPKDVVKVRAWAEGYKYEEVTVQISSRQDHLLINLSPLSNTLRAVGHTYFVGRASLAFLTDEALNVRVQNRENGFSVALTQTGKSSELADSLEGLRNPLIADVQARQLGEDLLIEVSYSESASGKKPEIRSRQRHDPIRDLHVYSLDLVGDDTVAVERTRSALARIGSADVTGCALVFDESLRDGLEPAALARALAPRGEFTDPYLRAAMRRLGEVSPGGVIRMTDGTPYHPSVPIELAAAVNQAAEAKGYLALLERLITLLEPEPFRDSTLRSLVAPELAPSAFESVLSKAEAGARRCRGGQASR